MAPWTAGLALDVASGLAMLLLGALVLRVRPRRRANLALAGFAFAMGGAIVVARADILLDAAGLLLYPAFALVLAAGAPLMLLAAWAPRPLPRSQRWLLMPAAAIGGVYLAWSFATLTNPANTFRTPLSTLVFAGNTVASFTYFAASGLLALRFATASEPALRRQLAYLGAAALAYPALFVGLFARTLNADVAPLLLVVAVWVANLRAPPAEARAARNVLLFAASLVLLGIAFRLAFGSSLVGGTGLGRMATLAVFAYALMRHQLLDLDLKVKWTIKQSTVAGVFIGVFFIVSEGAQQIFASTAGPVVGIVAAGALLFALTPLQHAAERVASAAVPGAKPVAAMSGADRARLYREQARFMWQDGQLSEDERRALLHLRDQLGLSRDEAARLEEEALGERARAA